MVLNKETGKITVIASGHCVIAHPTHRYQRADLYCVQVMGIIDRYVGMHAAPTGMSSSLCHCGTGWPCHVVIVVLCIVTVASVTHHCHSPCVSPLLLASCIIVTIVVTLGQCQLTSTSTSTSTHTHADHYLSLKSSLHWVTSYSITLFLILLCALFSLALGTGSGVCAHHFVVCDRWQLPTWL